jgi:hypothetical protein
MSLLHASLHFRTKHKQHYGTIKTDRRLAPFPDPGPYRFSEDGTLPRADAKCEKWLRVKNMRFSTQMKNRNDKVVYFVDYIFSKSETIEESPFILVRIRRIGPHAKTTSSMRRYVRPVYLGAKEM